LREAENAKALGGMRAPHRSLASLPRGASTGLKIRKLIEKFLDLHPELTESCCPQEGVAPQEFDQTLVDTLRKAILKSLGSEYGDLKPGISPEIIRAWCLATGDPDAVLAQWLEEGGASRSCTQFRTYGSVPIGSGSRAYRRIYPGIRNWLAALVQLPVCRGRAPEGQGHPEQDERAQILQSLLVVG